MFEVDQDEIDIYERIYHYRLAGESIHDIAKRFGITPGRAGHMFREFVTELAKLSDQGTRQTMVSLELDRLDQLQKAHWEMAKIGDDKATKTVLEIMKHRAKLLGLEQLSPTDALTVHSVLVVGTNTASFLESLESGRKRLSSGDPDNDIEGELELERESA